MRVDAFRRHGFDRCLGQKIDRRAGSGSSPRRCRRGSAALATYAFGAQSRHAGSWRRHRRWHLCAHRARGRRQCRPRSDAVVCTGGGGLRIRRTLLRRNGLDRPDQRERLYLCLRDARRIDGVDHRVGSDPRICGRRHHGCDRLVRLCRELGKRLRPESAGAVCLCAAGLRPRAARMVRNRCHLECPGGCGHSRDHNPAGDRHQGIGAFQRFHRCRQIDGHFPLHHFRRARVQHGELGDSGQS